MKLQTRKNSRHPNPTSNTSKMPTKPSSTSSSTVTDTAPLNGLRVLFGVSVVLMHTAIHLSLVFDHPTQASRLHNGGLLSTLFSIFQTLGLGAVDIFFMISGFLLKSSFSKTCVTMKTGTRYVVLRYLRLAPAYLTIMLILKGFGAPHCDSVMQILMIPAKDPVKTCNAVGWSTTVDFVSHILLLPILEKPGWLTGVLVVTPLVRGLTWVYFGRPRMAQPITIIDFIDSDSMKDTLSQAFFLPAGRFDLNDADLVERRVMGKEFNKMYFGIQYRIDAIVVGVLLYYSISQKNNLYRIIRRFPRLSLSGCCATWTLYHLIEREMVLTPFIVLLHRAIGRSCITLATCIPVILTCASETGEAPISRFVREILTCGIVKMVHRFSYVVYLLHPTTTFCMGLVTPVFRETRFSAGWLFVMGLKWYVFTMVFGFPVWCVEWLALRVRSRIKDRLKEL